MCFNFELALPAALSRLNVEERVEELRQACRELPFEWVEGAVASLAGQELHHAERERRAWGGSGPSLMKGSWSSTVLELIRKTGGCGE